MQEELDIFDEKLNKIGTAPRSEVHARGLLHQVVHCWIIAESEPVFWFQQRSKRKADFPGFYDLACGGHIDAGETPEQAICRELREELGLEAQEKDLISLGRYRAPDYQIPGYFDRAFSNVFVYRTDAPAFQIGEEVERMIRVNASDFCHMELKHAKIIPAEDTNGERFTVHRDNWCCHDGEFAARVLPWLEKAFPSFDKG